MGNRGYQAVRYRQLATVLVGVGWLPAVMSAWSTPPEADTLSHSLLWLLVTPLVLHASLLVVGWWTRAAFPNSAIGVMLLAPGGVLAAVAAEPTVWLPNAAAVRLAVALGLVGLVAWGSGRWAAGLVRTDTVDTM
jgi:hypothetical protein